MAQHSTTEGAHAAAHEQSSGTQSQSEAASAQGTAAAEAAEPADKQEGGKAPKHRWVGKVVVVALLALCVVLYFAAPSVNSWVNSIVYMFQTGNFADMRAFIAQYGVWAAAVSFLLMVFQSIAAPLPAFFITLTNANLFGWWQGAILSWTSAMAGAALCFWIARILGRDVVEKICTKGMLKQIDDFFDRYGSKSIIIARLLPFISFDIVSYAAGLTKMGFWSFFIATGIGQLPATIVYSYVGGMLTGGARLMFIGLLCLFAIAILISIIRSVYTRREKARAEQAAAAGIALPPKRPISAACIVSKVYNTLIWAFAISLFASLSVWLSMRISLGLVLVGAWVLLLVVFLLIRRVRMGWKFTLISTAVTAVVCLAVFGPATLSTAPAAFVRSMFGAHWPLGTVSSIICAVLVVLFVASLALTFWETHKHAAKNITIERAETR